MKPIHLETSTALTALTALNTNRTVVTLLLTPPVSSCRRDQHVDDVDAGIPGESGVLITDPHLTLYIEGYRQ